jgi:hypothetical protein
VYGFGVVAVTAKQQHPRLLDYGGEAAAYTLVRSRACIRQQEVAVSVCSHARVWQQQGGDACATAFDSSEAGTLHV